VKLDRAQFAVGETGGLFGAVGWIRSLSREIAFGLTRKRRRLEGANDFSPDPAERSGLGLPAFIVVFTKEQTPAGIVVSLHVGVARS
jgi:hypothetical protein